MTGTNEPKPKESEMTQTVIHADQIDATATLLRMIDALRRRAEHAEELDSETTMGLTSRVGAILNDLDTMLTGDIE